MSKEDVSPKAEKTTDQFILKPGNKAPDGLSSLNNDTHNDGSLIRGKDAPSVTSWRVISEEKQGAAEQEGIRSIKVICDKTKVKEPARVSLMTLERDGKELTVAHLHASSGTEEVRKEERRAIFAGIVESTKEGDKAIIAGDWNVNIFVPTQEGPSKFALNPVFVEIIDELLGAGLDIDDVDFSEEIFKKTREGGIYNNQQWKKEGVANYSSSMFGFSCSKKSSIKDKEAKKQQLLEKLNEAAKNVKLCEVATDERGLDHGPFFMKVPALDTKIAFGAITSAGDNGGLRKIQEVYDLGILSREIGKSDKEFSEKNLAKLSEQDRENLKDKMESLRQEIWERQEISGKKLYQTFCKLFGVEGDFSSPEKTIETLDKLEKLFLSKSSNDKSPKDSISKITQTKVQLAIAQWTDSPEFAKTMSYTREAKKIKEDLKNFFDNADTKRGVFTAIGKILNCQLQNGFRDMGGFNNSQEEIYSRQEESILDCVKKVGPKGLVLTCEDALGSRSKDPKEALKIYGDRNKKIEGINNEVPSASPSPTNGRTTTIQEAGVAQH